MGLGEIFCEGILKLFKASGVLEGAVGFGVGRGGIDSGGAGEGVKVGVACIVGKGVGVGVTRGVGEDVFDGDGVEEDDGVGVASGSISSMVANAVSGDTVSSSGTNLTNKALSPKSDPEKVYSVIK